MPNFLPQQQKSPALKTLLMVFTVCTRSLTTKIHKLYIWSHSFHKDAQQSVLKWSRRQRHKERAKSVSRCPFKMRKTLVPPYILTCRETSSYKLDVETIIKQLNLCLSVTSKYAGCLKGGRERGKKAGFVKKGATSVSQLKQEFGLSPDSTFHSNNWQCVCLFFKKIFVLYWQGSHWGCKI